MILVVDLQHVCYYLVNYRKNKLKDLGMDILNKDIIFNSIEELQAHLNKIADRENKSGLADFEGYSPEEMQTILYRTFSNNSPIHLKKLGADEYKKFPLFNQVQYLAHIIKDEKEVKLTPKGYLPTKIVGELCGQQFLPDEVFGNPLKVRKEVDSINTMLAKFILDTGGIIKKRNNKLSLTQNGSKIIENNQKLFEKIFDTYLTKINWSYFDGYGDNGIGQFAFGFSLILFGKYGRENKTSEFYAKKYFNAFPTILQKFEDNYYRDSAKMNYNCYSFRTFERFLFNFGLVEIFREKWDTNLMVRHTGLFDDIFAIDSPKYHID